MNVNHSAFSATKPPMQGCKEITLYFKDDGVFGDSSVFEKGFFVLVRQITPIVIHFKNLGFQHPVSSSGTYFHNWEVRMDRLSSDGRESVSSFYLFIYFCTLQLCQFQLKRQPLKHGY